VAIARGDRFCQGVFLPFGTAEEDGDFAVRTGGFGSTDRK
jgi:dUTP pyrophosphatase